MNRLHVKAPVSGGILLSYKCTSGCKHCMYACSPQWKEDWLSEEDARKILAQLSGNIKGNPYGTNGIGINFGLHFTGGEPFLNFDLLLRVTRMAYELKIPATFVETSCFWCVDDKATKEKFRQLKGAGLNGILISVNPFILEHVSFDRTDRAIRACVEIFGRNVIVYQEFFYHLFKDLNIRGTMSFQKFLRKAGNSLQYVELLPMGRAVYELEYLYKKYDAEQFFGISCKEELTRDWHIHIDNYGNYICGYCGGISLGDARELSTILKGIDLDERPILNALVTDLKKLYEIGVKEFNYRERSEGYISKCHFCVDVRRHIAYKTEEFKELRPREFYYHF